MSHTEGVGLDLPGWLPAANLGRDKASSAYARLSKEKTTDRVGLARGFSFFHPLTALWTWWGNGKLVTGPVSKCLSSLTVAWRSWADVGSVSCCH